MNDFRTLLRDVAEHASPPPDLAERALAGARTRRRRASLPVMAAAAASVVVVLVGGTFTVTSLMPDPPEWSVADGTAGGQEITFPRRAETLPAGGVGRAVLAYQPACDDPSGERCEPWRIMTEDNEHYELSTGRTGPAPGAQVTVSPAGDRIAYWRPDGRVVLHELDSGRVKEQFGWDSVEPVSGRRYAWSADGRWLLGVPCESWGPDAGCGANARLVDTDSGETHGIGSGPRVALGDLSDGDSPSVFAGLGTPARDDEIGLGSGQWLSMYGIDAEDIQGGEAGPVLGSTSPDGSTLAAITFPEADQDGQNGQPVVSIVDVAEKDVVAEFRIEGEPARWENPRFLGWQDERHVLVGTSPRNGSADGSGEAPPGPSRVESFDVRTGERQTVLRLPDAPAGIALAYDRL